MWFLIGAKELEQYLDEGRRLKLIDLRDRAAYLRSHIRGAVNIPAEQLAGYLSRRSPGQITKRMQDEAPEPIPDEIRKNFLDGTPDTLFVLYCYHGPQSMRAAMRLSALGFSVADLCGGIEAYKLSGGKHLVRGAEEENI